MTENSPAGPDQVPEACTLPTAEQPLRLAEFDALFSTAVRAADRRTPRHLGLTLPGGEQLASTVRDLAERETQCCSFFTFTVTTPAPGVVRLDIEVPAGHVDVLDTLQARAALVRDRP
ncbi:hypothetical protein [Hamadaea tsunoensis]|uniref:hypothetical protein n=1 Tax=Hamadaea tsunoensis TaxID=53368 RepID=UPI0003FEA48B|nr:hypothetical protein [Hamadaea tsunoensis]